MFYFFCVFESNIAKLLKMMDKKSKYLTRMKKLNFWVKFAVFIKKRKMIFATHGLKTICNMCSKFKNDLINILRVITSQSIILLE